jgi:hypothetical protein
MSEIEPMQEGDLRTRVHSALFTGDRIRGILAGYKTQTRRPVRGTALRWLGEPSPFLPEYVADPGNFFSPFGYTGHQLYVREAWAPMIDADTLRAKGPPERTDRIVYRADGEQGEGFKWRPSIHMPQWAARIYLDVLAVRIERLTAISESDAKAEGVQVVVSPESDAEGMRSLMFRVPTPYAGPMEFEHVFRWHFAAEWDELYFVDHPWSDDPWVWVCEFKLGEVLR